MSTVGEVPAETFELTHIPRDEYEREKRPLRAVLEEFLAFVGPDCLAGHNIYAYDLPILARVLQEQGLPFPEGGNTHAAVDTLHWARVRYPTPPTSHPDGSPGALSGYQLGELYRFFTGQELRGAHRALDDCAATCAVFSGLLNDAPPPLLQRLWHHLKLPEARFYPVKLDEGADLEDIPFLHRLLRVQALVPRILSPGKDFPSMEDVFPEWAEQVVRRGVVEPEELTEFLRRVARCDTDSPGVADVMQRHARAAQQAEMVLRLAGSFRVKRQADGEWCAPQADMARMVQRVLNQEGAAAIIEAPTGTGKTKAYLFPAQHHVATQPGQRVIVATHTKVLQEQALNELGQYARHYRTNAVSVKSARNYICLEALHDALRDFSPKEGSEEEAAALAALAAYTHEGAFELEALPGHWQFNKAFRELSFSLESYPERCRAACLFYHCCAYQQDRRFRDEASIWVTNQAYLLASFAQEDLDAGSSKPTHIIIDEAHNLEDVATEALSQSGTGERLRFHLQRLYDPDRRRGLLSSNVPPEDRELAKNIRQFLLPRAFDALRELDKHVTSFVKQHGEGDAKFGVEHLLTPSTLASADWQRLKRIELLFLDAVRQLRDALGTVIHHNLRGLLKPTLEYFKAFTELAFSRHQVASWNNMVHTTRWQEVEGWAYVARPIDLAGWLSGVWNRAASVTLTSATLRSPTLEAHSDPAREYAYIKRTLGLPDKTELLTLPETLPYERAHVLFPQHLPGARTENLTRFQQLFHQDLQALLPHARRSLTLFTSRARMQAAGEALKTLTPLMPLNRKEREEVALSMRQDGNKIALGTRAFMEGVDFPDLKLVGLERIPFPVPDALLRARQALVEQAGLDPWYDFYLPKALLSFTQAFGRLIRDDRRRAGDGAFVLWDKRVLSAAYREVVFAALPGSVASAGNFHYPGTRVAFYDELAPLLGVPRELLPTNELIAEVARDLHALQAAYAAGELTREEGIQKLLELFWPQVARAGLKPQQWAAVHAALNGQDVLTLLPTGYGKSLTFQLPALLLGGVTLVVSPLIALMDDQVSALQVAGVPAAAVHAGRSGAEQRAILEEAERGELHLLYVSPERINRNEQFKDCLRALRDKGLLRRIVFDEAHCLSDWGHDFRPDYGNVIRTLRQQGVTLPVSALTATATPAVEAQLQRELCLRDAAVVRASLDRPNLTYFAYGFRGRDTSPIEKLKRVAQILSWLQEQHPEGSAIVYVATRNAAERLALALKELKFATAAYHAGLSALVRSEVQAQFMEGSVRVIVATNAFGMGVDKANVRVVIHFNPPASLPAYIQEAGRAGRDGEPAWSVLLHDAHDWSLQSWLVKQGRPERSLAQAVFAFAAGGTRTAYEKDLLESLNADLPEGSDKLERGDLNWLLALLEDAGNILTTYRLGKVRLLSSLTREELEAALGAQYAALLFHAGYQPGRRPCVLDLARLPQALAEDLSGRLFALARQRPLEVLYTAHEPAMDLTVLRTDLTAFEQRLAQQLQVKQDHIQAVRAFARTDERASACRRRELLRVFEQDLNGPRDDATCCDRCNGDDAPWAATPELSTEAIEEVYRVQHTVLAFLEELSKVQRTLGLTKLVMTLRGVTQEVRKDRDGATYTVQVPWFAQVSPFFGRLEFVSNKEIQRALRQAVTDGLAQTCREWEGFTYAITEAGVQHLDRQRHHKNKA